MIRKDVPQGIRATALGYPKRVVGGSFATTSEQRKALLSRYSDEQLSSVGMKTEVARRGMKAIKVGAGVLAAAAYIAKDYAITAGWVAHVQGVNPDAITQSIESFYLAGADVFARLGMHDRFTEVMSAVYAPIALPLIAAVGATYAEKSYAKQNDAVNREQRVRFTSELISRLTANQQPSQE